MEYIILIVHLVIDFCIGFTVLKILGKTIIDGPYLCSAIALGMFLETISIWLLSLIGLSIGTSFILISVIALGSWFYHFLISTSKPTWRLKPSLKSMSVWEVPILLFIAEKIVWSLYSLAKFPVYFDQTLKDWSGRSKALLSTSNWSWEPDSINFVGHVFSLQDQPLFASIWRATNASFLGRHDPGLERVDGFIFWVIVIAITYYWIREFTGKRWTGLLGAAIIAALPLQTWHATGGHTEIYVQAYLLLALFALHRNQYILAGLFSSAMIWSQNEGLIIFLPAFAGIILFKLILAKDYSLQLALKKLLVFSIAVIIPISPWILFKIKNGLSLTPSIYTITGYNEGALSKMCSAVFNSPSSSIFWIFCTITIIICIKRILKDRTQLFLSTSGIILILTITYFYTCAGAFQLLDNQLQIHRTLLQITPPFVILCCISLIQKGKTALTPQDA